MSTTTPKQAFTKPDGSDAALIAVLNTNWDLADEMVTLTSSQTLTNKTLTAPHMTSPVVDSGGITITGNSSISGTLSGLTGVTLTSGALTLSGTTGTSGSIRLANSAGINWRNAAGSADLTLNYNASDMLSISTSATAISNTATAGANALPANPYGFLSVAIDGITRKIPLYNN